MWISYSSNEIRRNYHYHLPRTIEFKAVKIVCPCFQLCLRPRAVLKTSGTIFPNTDLVKLIFFVIAELLKDLDPFKGR